MSEKAKKKRRKRHKLLLSPAKPLEEHKHDDVDLKGNATLSDHLSFHRTAHASFYSNCKCHEKEAVQEQECRGAASEPSLVLDDHHILPFAASDDMKGSVANFGNPGMEAVEEREHEDADTGNLSEVEMQEHEDAGTQKDFLLGDNSTVKDSPSIASYLSVEEVKEDQESRDPNVEDNTPVQPEKAKKKRKKRRQTLLSTSEPLEGHRHDDTDTGCISVPDDNSNAEDKDNSSISEKAPKKRKKHSQPLLFSSEPLEGQKHEDLDADNIPALDDDSNVKDKEKAKRKKKKHHQPPLSSSQPLEGHRHEDTDAGSIFIPDHDLNVEDKDNSSIPSSPVYSLLNPGKVGEKQRRHRKKNLSPSKHLKQVQHGNIGAQSIPVPGDGSNINDNSSVPSSLGHNLFLISECRENQGKT
ncbi:hypothetical protein Tsubulata_047729 [Turnera subulata]|uniref:Uncharacterized protein n=1 Tax=Turnera subulata TaxID=218843 RepID=A0A9Q0FLU7_9ROSI|nr:hypothetical protein Tsubulata_047729 [Turnera subulata]